MLCKFLIHLEPDGMSAEVLKKECGHTLDELIPSHSFEAEIACPPNINDTVIFPTTVPGVFLRGNITSKELNLVDPKNSDFDYSVVIWSVDVG